MQVYDGTFCQYKNESFLNTSIMIGGSTVFRTTAINNTYCLEDFCNIVLTDITMGAVGDLVVSVVAGNKFVETAATPSEIMCKPIQMLKRS